MLFSTIKYEFDNSNERIENKQRISLTPSAIETLLSDLDIFHGSDKAYVKKEDISSADLNRIFEHFRRHAMSSVSLQIRAEEIRLNQVLANIDLSNRRAVVAYLLEDYRSELLKKTKSDKNIKRESITFRINTGNMNYLASDDGQDEASFYDDRVGKYMATVFEEYCRLSFFSREGYYYQDWIAEIKAAIAEKTLLKITLRSQSQRNGEIKNNIQYVKPVLITETPEHLYHYVVGATASSREGPWKIGSIRLTSMLKCDKLEQIITHYSELCGAVNEAIKEKGIQFLSDDQSSLTVVVQFTPRGEQMYKSILHLRPNCIEKAENRVYKFKCSFSQARNYFFRFGKDACVLSPAGLSGQLEREYANAARVYREKNNIESL